MFMLPVVIGSSPQVVRDSTSTMRVGGMARFRCGRIECEQIQESYSKGRSSMGSRGSRSTLNAPF